MLHVHSGDCAAATLVSAGSGGTHVVWTELLMQGPLRPACGREAFRSERADVLSAATGGARTRAQCLERLCRQDDALEQWTAHDETVVWVDACLYDQAILVCLLQHFAERPAAVQRLRVVCIGHHAEVPDFHGLGQLSPAQMAALLPLRQAVSPEQCDLARQAWRAMCAPTPTEIEALSRQATPALPYLQSALRRWLELLPSSTNGLCRLQQEVLEAVRDGGEASPVQVFVQVSARERPAFFGDTFLWRCINDLAFCRVPLLRLDGDQPLPLWDTGGIKDRRLALTLPGEAVGGGRADAIALNGIDRWLGGVHLRGQAQSPWRWDPCQHRVEQTACQSGADGARNATTGSV